MEINNTDTSVFLLKAKCGADKLNLEKKISDVDEKVTDLVRLLKKQIIVLKLLKYNVKHLASLVQLLH